MLKVPKSRRHETTYELCPAILREWGKKEEISNSALYWPCLQAAALAAYFGLSNAYVIWSTPMLKPAVRVFVVGLKDNKKGEARRLVVEALDAMRKACETGVHDELPLCPEFIRTRCDPSECRCLARTPAPAISIR